MGKNEGDLQRDTSMDEQAIEQAKAERVEINFEALYYPIVAPTITDGIATLQEFIDTRDSWIQEWDDPKRRALRYSKRSELYGLPESYPELHCQTSSRPSCKE